ncbi:MAG: tRNA dihydrouridine synthase DusB [Candidatus Sumerlaeia bacterium]|nr:tRNA dihydrouridine synthase DusB [Candidatus Sumerlaeia bacterium]
MKTFHIAGLEPLAPVVPAPMSGYSDRAWREIARAMGCNYLIVPLVSAEGLARADVKTEALVDIEGERRPVVVQLFGSRPASLAAAAQRLEARGVSAIDLNLGCPARRIVAHDGGAALLKHPRLVAELMHALRSAVHCPVTAKIRAGWDESSPPAVEIARILEAEGAAAIAIHARTGRQQFKGTADWRVIAAVKQAVRIPVIGNGDIRSGADAWRMCCETGCDAVMIGRAAIGNPWLWREALAWLAAEGPPPTPPAPPSLAERLDMLRQHAALMARYRGEPRGIVEFRKHAVQYLRGVRNSRPLKHVFLSCTTLADIAAAIEAFQAAAAERPLHS